MTSNFWTDEVPIILRVGLDPRFQTHVCVFRPFFFFSPSAWIVTSHEFTVQEKNTVHALFLDPTTLFTCLKIILLQYFQFSVSAKISCIQMDPNWEKDVHVIKKMGVIYIDFTYKMLRNYELKLVVKVLWKYSQCSISQLIYIFDRTMKRMGVYECA